MRPRRPPVLAAIAILLAAAPLCAYPHSPGYELVIEHSPMNAGCVMPNAGTHLFSPDSSVTLTAQPQPGYRFAYWLGDISDPGSQRTTIVLTEPKVVVAVFQPATDEPLDYELLPAGGGGADGGMLLAAATDFSSPGWSPAGGARAHTRRIPSIAPPAPTPEPTTIALLALGAVALRCRPPR